MSDRFTGIGSVRPSYPVKPVEPSGRDRPSGDRQKKPADKPEDSGEADEGNDSQRPKQGTIDEYI